MSQTFCGKSCAECPEREAANCPGCRLGPGKPFGGTCKLAKCVQSKGHETCETCSFQVKCATYANRHQVPDDRRREAEAEEFRWAEVTRRAPILKKWIGMLFWLCIPNTIGEFLTSDLMQEVSMAYEIGMLIQFLSTISYGVILLRLSSVDNRYMTAGIRSLVCSIVNSLVQQYSTDSGLTLLVAVPLLIAALYGEYCEYMAHSTAVSDIDADLMLKWENLWKWNLGTNIGMICATFLIVIPLLGALTIFGFAIGTIVVGIMKLVYLYRTSKAFREYCD